MAQQRGTCLSCLLLLSLQGTAWAEASLRGATVANTSVTKASEPVAAVGTAGVQAGAAGGGAPATNVTLKAAVVDRVEQLEARMKTNCFTILYGRDDPTRGRTCVVSGSSPTAGGDGLSAAHFFCAANGIDRTSIQEYTQTHSAASLRCSQERHFHLWKDHAGADLKVSIKCGLERGNNCKFVVTQDCFGNWRVADQGSGNRACCDERETTSQRNLAQHLMGEQGMRSAGVEEEYTPPVPGFGFLGYGYNVANANPMQSSGQPDRGFQGKIFRFSASRERTHDGKYLIPEKATAVAAPTCTSELNTRFVHSEEELRKELSASLQVSGSSSWSKLAFHANAEYQSEDSTVSSGTSVLALSAAQCSTYRVQMNTFDVPPLRLDFVKAIERLPLEYEARAYSRILDAFGTHFVSRADLGGRLGKMLVMERRAFQNLKRRGVNLDAGVEATSWGVTGSIGGKGSVDERARREVQAATSSAKDFSIGGQPQADQSLWLEGLRENPMPMSLGLTPITELLNRHILPCIPRVEEKRQLLQRAIDEYCSYRGIDCSVSGPAPGGSDELRMLPLAPFTHPRFAVSHGWASQDAFPRHLADVNGDGKADIVAFGESSVSVSLSEGTRFGAAQSWIHEFGLSQGWVQVPLPRFLGDVNGDGKADIVAFGWNSIFVSLSEGTRFGAKQSWLEFGGRDQVTLPRHVADVDGDGKADIVAFGIGGVFVSLSSGRGFGAMQLWLEDLCTVQGWENQIRFPRLLADVNGDGKADIVAFGSGGVVVSLSSGRGFGSLQSWLNNFGTNQGWSDQVGFPRLLADVNGDGMADIVGFGASATMVSLSMGHGFGSQRVLEESPFQRRHGWTSSIIFPIAAADVSGNRRADILGFGEHTLSLLLSQ